VDRSRGTKFGTCKLAEESRVSTFFHHPGEELIYRGRLGSGTIFFTSCNMRCAFCQNGDISTDKDNGIVVSPRTLATMAWLLRMEGCHNVNWVGGEVTIHLHTIVEAISLLADLHPQDQDLRAALPVKSDYFARFRYDPGKATYRGAFNAPMLWNSNFFMSVPTMKILRVLMDVWLPDLKFGPGKCAIALSRTPWYWETVTDNIKMIYEWGEDFTIRHLVMPNHVECCTRPVLEWIAENMPDVPVNVMDQYHPDNFCDPRSAKYNPKYEELSRRPTSQEILRAFAYARELGLQFESLSYEKNATGLHL
jgi:putative pyruvate formate lyase activating enzyme